LVVVVVVVVVGVLLYTLVGIFRVGALMRPHADLMTRVQKKTLSPFCFDALKQKQLMHLKASHIFFV